MLWVPSIWFRYGFWVRLLGGLFHWLPYLDLSWLSSFSSWMSLFFNSWKVFLESSAFFLIILISRSNFYFPPFILICSSFFFKFSGIDAKLFIFCTFWGILLQVEIVVNIAIVINGLDILWKLWVSGLQALKPVLTEIFQFIHESFAFVVDQVHERSCTLAFILKDYFFGLIWGNDVLFWRLERQGHLFFWNFWFKKALYLVFYRFLGSS